MPRALVLDRTDDGLRAAVRHLDRADLPDLDVLVEVDYSSLNYKDGLAVTGTGKIIRGDYPFVPGIDLAGRVAASRVPAFTAGDEVIGTGWGLGEQTWGGYAREQRVRAEWLVPRPEGLSLRRAMIAGTAGLTAMLGVMALEDYGVAPDRGEVVVTGASGGAGSFGVALLARLGYTVAAVTGSEEAHDYLRALGADRLLPREELSSGPERPLERGRWAGALDAVGGDTLATLLAQTGRHGAVAAFGNAGGHELHTTVFPFILRGVGLLGIDSNTCPAPRRHEAWRRLAGLLDEGVFDRIHGATITLDEVPDYSRRILQGDVRGRVVVDLAAE